MRTPTVFDILNMSFTPKKEEYIHYSCSLTPTHWDCKKGIHPGTFVFRVPSEETKIHLEACIAAIPMVYDK